MCVSFFLGARCATRGLAESVLGYSVRRTAGTLWMPSCAFGFCRKCSSPEGRLYSFECSASDSLNGQSVETWAWCHLRPDQSTSSLTRRLDQVCAPNPDVSERQHVRCSCSQYVSIVKLHGFKTRKCHHGSGDDGRSSSCAE